MDKVKLVKVNSRKRRFINSLFAGYRIQQLKYRGSPFHLLGTVRAGFKVLVNFKPTTTKVLRFDF